MKIVKIGFFLLLGLVISTTLLAEENTTETSKTETIAAKRGNIISIKDLSLVADISSARDERGNPATLPDENYTIGAYSSSTISVMPIGNKDPESLVTLDLLKKK